jgi:hypothetical protein
MQELANQLEQAFNQIGTSMMSDDFCSKLLAYVYVMGGGNEAVVMHSGLNAGIRIAQEKANIKGGEIPNAKLLPLIQERIKELEGSYKEGKYQCAWLTEIYERYNFTDTPKKSKKKK